MIHELVEASHPYLTTKISDFDFSDKIQDPQQIARDLYETMLHNKAFSLAAPQIGMHCRAFALYAVPGIVCFNPKIVDESQEEVLLDESCATYPHLFLPIKRARRIKVRYTQPDGEVITRVLDGMTARCFMHELDHLNGYDYRKRANKVHLERAMRKKKELDRLVKNATTKGLL